MLHVLLLGLYLLIRLHSCHCSAKEKLGQPCKLVIAHTEALLNLESHLIPCFYNSIKEHMRAVSSLGRSSESYGPLLTSSVLSKLSTETKKHMAHEHPNSEWTIDEVLSSMFKEIQIFCDEPAVHWEIQQSWQCLTNYQPILCSCQQNINSSDRHQEERVCVFYKYCQKPNNCNVIVSTKERLAIVKQERICLAWHKIAQCNSK